MKKIISLTKALYKNSKNDSGKLKIKSKIFLYVLLAIYLLFVFFLLFLTVSFLLVYY